MAHGLTLTRINLGPINSLEDASNALRDVESQLNILIQVLRTPDANPGVGALKVLAKEEDGSYHLYTLIGGAGVTITPDTTAKTITLTSP